MGIPRIGRTSVVFLAWPMPIPNNTTRMPNGQEDLADQYRDTLRRIYWQRRLQEENLQRIKLFNRMADTLVAAGLTERATEFVESASFQSAEASRMSRELGGLESTLTRIEEDVVREARTAGRAAGLTEAETEGRIGILRTHIGTVSGAVRTEADSAGMNATLMNLGFRNQEGSAIQEDTLSSSLRAQSADYLSARARDSIRDARTIGSGFFAAIVERRIEEDGQISASISGEFRVLTNRVEENAARASNAAPLRAALSGPLIRADAAFMRAEGLGKAMDVGAFTSEIRSSLRRSRTGRDPVVRTQRGAPRP